MFQVDQRVWLALPVEGRSPRPHEAHSLVKSDGLAVLLVDIRRHLRVHREAVPNEGCAYSATPVRRINEERFHMAILDQHECQWIVIAIDRQPERNLREEMTHHVIKRLTILRRQKFVRGINRIAPDCDDAPGLVGT